LLVGLAPHDEAAPCVVLHRVQRLAQPTRPLDPPRVLEHLLVELFARRAAAAAVVVLAAAVEAFVGDHPERAHRWRRARRLPQRAVLQRAQ
jgi:hypothetical protein